MGSKKLVFEGDYSSFHFAALSRLSGYELVDNVRKAIESLYQNPNLEEPIRRLYERSYLQINDPRVLSLIISEIDKIDARHIDFGDFYEHLLRILGTQKEAGQFLTPRQIIKFMVDVIDPQIGETILDPACGTAGFLTQAYLHIAHANTSEEARDHAYLDKLNADQRKFLLNNTIFGYDIDPHMIKFAITNLYLHGITNPHISQHNTLTSSDGWEKKYDIILANPPFATPKGGIKPVDLFTLNSNRTEVLFVEYFLEHLTLNGRAAVIVPEGIIFQSGTAFRELREWLVEDNCLYAVASLPPGIFNPYSPVKTSILFIDRELARKTKDILFIKITADGFDLGAQRRAIEKNDLPLALATLQNYKKVVQENTDANIVLDSEIESGIATLVQKTKIVESGDYNLTSERYREIKLHTKQKWPIIELSSVCDIQNGYAFKSQDYIKESNTLNFRMSNIRPDGTADISYHPKYLPDSYAENYKQYLLQDGDVVIAMTDMASDPKILGVPTIVKKDNRNLLLNQRVGKFININEEKIYIPFLKHVLSSETVKSYYKTLGGGGLQLNISKHDILKIQIPLPLKDIQQEIVAELEGYQKIIDGAKQVVENYKPTIKIDPNWKIVELGELCEVKGGKRIPKGLTFSSTKTQHPYLRVVDLSNNTIDQNNLKYIDEDIFSWIKNYTISSNDVYISIAGTIGLVGTIPENLNGANLTENAAKLIIKDKTLLEKTFLALVLTTKNSELQIKKFTHAVGVPKLALERIKLIKIPLPPLDVQRQIIVNIEEEQRVIEGTKMLINIFEQKIKDKIAEVWGETHDSKQPEVALQEELPYAA